MKKNILFVITILAVCLNYSFAQTHTLKKVMELTMPKTPKPEDDIMAGTRGAGVCWNPVTKKYYAAFCGNAGYPLAVFDATGKILSKDTLTTMNDIRGIWYNAASNKIMTNCYSSYGWASYELNKAGIPVGSSFKYEGMYLPNEQCVGSFDNKLKQVFFLQGSRVIRYNTGTATASPAAVDSVQIHWGRKKADGPGDDEDATVTNEDYNYTNVIATGMPGAELGLLNTYLKQVELYDIKTGFLKQILKLPDTATAEQSFNFAYSNGIYWLFDMDSRIWTGYK